MEDWAAGNRKVKAPNYLLSAHICLSGSSYPGCTFSLATKRQGQSELVTCGELVIWEKEM